MTPTTMYTLHFEFDAPASALTGSAVTAHLRAMMTAFAALSAITVTVAGLYLLKSALGINLFAGHSPLHDLLYHFVR